MVRFLRMIGPCSLFGCGKPAQTLGLCAAHYKAKLRHGDPTTNNRSKAKKKCAAAGCEELTTVEYCDAHRHRALRHGSAEHKPPRGPRPFQGPCAEFGCGKVATKTGRCPRHSKQPEDVRALLPMADIEHIRANRNGLKAEQLADRFNTTASTVVAVQGGRNWGYLRG